MLRAPTLANTRKIAPPDRRGVASSRWSADRSSEEELRWSGGNGGLIWACCHASEVFEFLEEDANRKGGIDCGTVDC